MALLKYINKHKSVISMGRNKHYDRARLRIQAYKRINNKFSSAMQHSSASYFSMDWKQMERNI